MMHMLTTNLLPPSQQLNIARERWVRAVLFVTGSIGSVLIIGSVLLSPSYLPLLLEKQELERAHAAVQDKAQELHVQETLASINAVHSFLRTIHEIGNSNTSAAFLHLLPDAQSSVTLSQLIIRNHGSVTMNGHAPTRNDLLRFEEQLRESGYVQDIVSPLSNIVQETDINFVLQAKIKQ